jgi:hypothetical protein
MAWMGGALAATRLAQQQQEEEDMAEYAQDDLRKDWEFKIVRSDSAVFRKPEVLNRLLEEEAQAGWVLLEKLDDSRIRFKRPRSAQSRDAYLPPDVDPYRTQYGAPAAQRAQIAVVIGLLVTLMGGVMVFWMAGSAAGSTEAVSAPPWIAVSIVVLGIVVLGMLLVRKSR